MKPYMDPSQRRRMAKMEAPPEEPMDMPSEDTEEPAPEETEDAKETMSESISIPTSKIGSPKPGDVVRLTVQSVDQQGNALLAMEQETPKE